MTKETTKPVRKIKTNQKKFQKTLAKTFALFKDFARSDESKARLAN